MADSPRNLGHLFPTDYAETRRYRASGGGSSEPPRRNRGAHGGRIRDRLRAAVDQSHQEAEIEAAVVGLEGAVKGTYITFRAADGYDLPIVSLENSRRGIEIVRVRKEGESLEATVFVPEGEEGFFDQKIQQYLERETRTGKPKNQALIAGIEDVEAASLLRLWSSDPQLFPGPTEVIWWEVWVREAAVDVFQQTLQQLDLAHSDHHLAFPERQVVTVRGTSADIDRLRFLSGAIAEVRRQRETPTFFVGQDPVDQREWSDDLLDRIEAPTEAAPAICILDTGVNREHPLLADLLSEDDWHAWKPTWPKADNRAGSAHGTGMAGLAAYGDLHSLLETGEPVNLTHRLESVRILPPGTNPNPRHLYGAITIDAVGQAELAGVDRRRAFCLAVTTDDACDGRPTSWSATIDNLAAGELDDVKRLFVVSAGNVRTLDPCPDYLQRCAETASEEPAQSWNALVVGACTFLQHIDDPSFSGWSAVAPSGELSPYSTTSCSWEGKWPVRPDVVVEGGNLAKSPTGRDWDSPTCLGVLTTHHDVPRRIFDTFHATSAATAQVSALVGQALHAFPNSWEETIRALVVHSAAWPEPLRTKFQNANKTERGRLLRMYGFGVPHAGKIALSARNDVTVIVEDEMAVVDPGGTMSQAHFYDLPWTSAMLTDLGETPIKLRVTLSYFVEANPAERGWKGRYRYASHGFRFHLQRPNESERAFLGRINAEDQDDDWFKEGGEDGWFLGRNQRDRGTLHSDIWEGTAQQLSGRRKLAIVPVGGWWKTPRSGELRARYSLVVSLETPEVDVDLYTPVQTELANLATLPVIIQT